MASKKYINPAIALKLFPLTSEPATYASAIVVGELTDAEFADLRDAIETMEWLHVTRSVSDEELAELSEELSEEPIDWLIVANARPGSVDRQLWNALKGQLSVKQTLVVSGSWCEGELRTGQPLEADKRIYWHQFLGWLATETGTGNSTWKDIGPVLVSTYDYEAATAWCEIMGEGGGTALWHRPNESLLAGQYQMSLWIGGQLTGQEAERLAQHCSEMRRQSIPTVVLLDYPRYDEVSLAKELGAAAVLGRPTSSEELLALCVNQCVQLSASRTKSFLTRNAA